MAFIEDQSLTRQLRRQAQLTSAQMEDLMHEGASNPLAAVAFDEITRLRADVRAVTEERDGLFRHAQILEAQLAACHQERREWRAIAIAAGRASK